MTERFYKVMNMDIHCLVQVNLCIVLASKFILCKDCAKLESSFVIATNDDGHSFFGWYQNHSVTALCKRVAVF